MKHILEQAFAIACCRTTKSMVNAEGVGNHSPFLHHINWSARDWRAQGVPVSTELAFQPQKNHVVMGGCPSVPLFMYCTMLFQQSRSAVGFADRKLHHNYSNSSKAATDPTLLPLCVHANMYVCVDVVMCVC
jgi:hypothetical protein